MAYPALKQDFAEVFDARPRGIEPKTVGQKDLSVAQLLNSIQRKIARDVKLLSTSSDNMHHI